MFGVGKCADKNHTIIKKCSQASYELKIMFPFKGEYWKIIDYMFDILANCGKFT